MDNWLKDVTRRTVSAVGARKNTANQLHVSQAEISYWCNDFMPRSIPAHHLVHLDEMAGDIFLREWAHRRGFDLVSRNPSQEASLCVIKSVGQLSKEAGELGFTVLDAVADNVITPAERRRIRDDIAPVKDAIDQLERAIA
jgi:hypothetical protein